ncbi:MAG: DUF1844 domain-containing protein [Planctomycetota bacterium]|nr:MAG: DUF1844 domain-containing protein [Planctomycetota bacterium]
MSDNEPDSTPKIIVDTDWKAEAQAEKQRLAKKAEEAEAKAGGKSGELPQANFQMLVGTLASQAVMGLGAVRDPKTGGVVVDLEAARFAIDLLAVIEDKTKGNLTDEETKEVSQALAELRARFVQVSDAVKTQVAAGVAPPVVDPG